MPTSAMAMMNHAMSGLVACRGGSRKTTRAGNSVVMGVNTKRTLKRAKAKLKIITEKGGYQGEWQWRLP